MTTYTVESPAGDVIARHLTAREAMDRILSHDGGAHYIIPADDKQGWTLWFTEVSHAALIRGAIRSDTIDFDDAADDLALKVIDASWDWHGYPVAMTDEYYNQWRADLAAYNHYNRRLAENGGVS